MCRVKEDLQRRLLLLYGNNSRALVGMHVHSLVVGFFTPIRHCLTECPRTALLLALHDIYSLECIVSSVYLCSHYTFQLRQDSCITQSFTLRHPWQSAPDPKIPLSHENDEEWSVACKIEPEQFEVVSWIFFFFFFIVFVNYSARSWAAFRPFSSFCTVAFAVIIFMIALLHLHIQALHAPSFVPENFKSGCSCS